MYLDFLVAIPDVPNKITYRTKSGVDYVYYEYAREYDSSTKKTNPKRATIGKRSPKNPLQMWPNEKFLKYFPDAQLPEQVDRTSRSSCLRIGDYLVIRRILKYYHLEEMLHHYLSKDECGLFMDLMAYSIVMENNAGQYYPMYAYNHPLFTEGMRIYSDSKVSSFLHSMTTEQSVGFLNEWNGERDHRERIYISYDSTNKSSQAGDINIVEYGHPKVDAGLPIFNYAVAYDTNNREPLFYEKYPGSINDISQLEYMLEKAYGYGYRHIGFILDRGYCSKSNLESIVEKGYSYVIMAKGMNKLLTPLIVGEKGKFEKKRAHHIEEYDVYGTTVKTRLFATDKNESYVHIYHSIHKESGERARLEEKLRTLKRFMERHTNEVRTFGPGFEQYFYLHYNEKTGQFQFGEEKTLEIEAEMELCGYFCIITSEKMTSKDAIHLYKSRDASEKLFSGDKSYLGNKSIRVGEDDAADAKIFIEFVALIVRNRIYTCLQEKMKQMDKKPNFMTVPAALKELEKIEIVRQTDNIYRLDHAVTKTQKIILDAFGITEGDVKNGASEISKKLRS